MSNCSNVANPPTLKSDPFACLADQVSATKDMGDRLWSPFFRAVGATMWVTDGLTFFHFSHEQIAKNIQDRSMTWKTCGLKTLLYQLYNFICRINLYHSFDTKQFGDHFGPHPTMHHGGGNCPTRHDSSIPSLLEVPLCWEHPGKVKSSMNNMWLKTHSINTSPPLWNQKNEYMLTEFTVRSISSTCGKRQVIPWLQHHTSWLPLAEASRANSICGTFSWHFLVIRFTNSPTSKGQLFREFHGVPKFQFNFYPKSIAQVPC